VSEKNNKNGTFFLGLTAGRVVDSSIQIDFSNIPFYYYYLFKKRMCFFREKKNETNRNVHKRTGMNGVNISAAIFHRVFVILFVLYGRARVTKRAKGPSVWNSNIEPAHPPKKAIEKKKKSL
jgi:hypothetical protein